MGAREAILALADGRVFRGRAFGAIGEAVGELVFNTAMTGYQEVLTDPSYKGQIVCMTYPEIGNVGINAEDAESAGGSLRGLRGQGLSRAAVELALRDGTGRIPRTRRSGRHRRYRHTRAGASHPYPRRAGGGDLQRHARSRRAGGARQGLAGFGRARPGKGSHLRRALRLGPWRLGTRDGLSAAVERGIARRAADRRARLRNQAQHS